MSRYIITDRRTGEIISIDPLDLKLAIATGVLLGLLVLFH